jgi:hypothetical protein
MWGYFEVAVDKVGFCEADWVAVAEALITSVVLKVSIVAKRN